MADAEPDRVLPGPLAGPAEHRLHTGVVAGRVEAEVVVELLGAPGAAPAGQGPRQLAHVHLGVRAAVGPEREQLHQLTRVVLVGAALGVLVLVEPDDHRAVRRHVADELIEAAEGVAPEHLVLGEHQLLVAHAVVRGCEPVVPDERHALDERLARADHPVEEPEVVVAVAVERLDRDDRVRVELVCLVDRRRAGEGRHPLRPGERRHGPVQPHRGQQLGVARRRAEARSPEQALCLTDAEGAGVDRNRRAELEGRCGRRRRRRDRRLRHDARLRRLALALAGARPLAALAALARAVDGERRVRVAAPDHAGAASRRAGARAPGLRVGRLDRGALRAPAPALRRPLRCAARLRLTAPLQPSLLLPARRILGDRVHVSRIGAERSPT